MAKRVNVEDAVDAVIEQWRAERPELDTASLGIFGRIYRVARLAEKRTRANLAPLGVDPADFDVLATLRRVGPPFRLTHARLAESMLVTAQAVTGRIDRLEQRELVRRIVDPADRRVSLVELTMEGRLLAEHAMDQHLALEARLLADLPEADRAKLADSLRVLLAVVSQE